MNEIVATSQSIEPQQTEASSLSSNEFNALLYGYNWRSSDITFSIINEVDSSFSNDYLTDNLKNLVTSRSSFSPAQAEAISAALIKWSNVTSINFNEIKETDNSFGTIRFGLSDIPLGLGTTTVVKTPVQATDELGRPLYIAPNGEITPNAQAFADNMVEDFYPLYLDEGELTFDLDGRLVSPITKVQYSGDLTQLTLDFTNATQFDQAFSASEIEQDGYSAGRLTNLEIDNYGNVRAGYSNGQNVSLGKIMLASFSNETGLKQIGNSTFIATAASGDPELGEASEDGFGQILSGSLERSNVDITEELVNLITSQRNYQAAAKAIETSTSMTQTIINIRS